MPKTFCRCGTQLTRHYVRLGTCSPCTAASFSPLPPRKTPLSLAEQADFTGVIADAYLGSRLRLPPVLSLSDLLRSLAVDEASERWASLSSAERHRLSEDLALRAWHALADRRAEGFRSLELCDTAEALASLSPSDTDTFLDLLPTCRAEPSALSTFLSDLHPSLSAETRRAAATAFASYPLLSDDAYRLAARLPAATSPEEAQAALRLVSCFAALDDVLPTLPLLATLSEAEEEVFFTLLAAEPSSPTSERMEELADLARVTLA